MTISDSRHEFPAATEDYPAALEPATLHGYLTAWALTFENQDTAPWLQEALGVDEAEPVPESARRPGEERIADPSRRITYRRRHRPGVGQ